MFRGCATGGVPECLVAASRQGAGASVARRVVGNH